MASNITRTTINMVLDIHQAVPQIMKRIKRKIDAARKRVVVIIAVMDLRLLLRMRRLAIEAAERNGSLALVPVPVPVVIKVVTDERG